MDTADVIIIGGGQAGLASAHHTLSLGLQPLILDASPGPGGSWPSYYVSLRLFSPARYSALPGMPFPGNQDYYPSRDETAAYLAAYAARIDVDIRYGERVQAVAKDGDGFAVETSLGGALRVEKVIVATGGFGRPRIPALAGIKEFTGRVLHSSAYLRPDGFAGQRVVVVGCGNSAVQIAVELSTTATVSLVTRHSLRWQQQRILGRDVHWWLDRTGLDRSRAGVLLARHGTPVVDDGKYRAAVRAGRPDRRDMFIRLTEEGIIWADGAYEKVDALILATGFLPEVSFLPAAALDPSGLPLHTGGVSSTIPGIGYVGLEHQRTFASATLRGVGPDAKHVIKVLHPVSANHHRIVR